MASQETREDLHRRGVRGHPGPSHRAGWAHGVCVHVQVLAGVGEAGSQISIKVFTK